MILVLKRSYKVLKVINQSNKYYSILLQIITTCSMLVLASKIVFEN